MGDNQGKPFDPKMLSEILGQSDETLRAAARAAAEAAGMSRLQTEMIARDAGAIRKKLSSVSEEEFGKFLSRITPEQLAALGEQIKKPGK